MSPKKKRTKKMTKAQVEEFFSLLSNAIVPESELDWKESLDLVVAVVLSAQATDVSVNKVTPWLRDHCKTPQDYLDLGKEKLEERIKTIGLYRTKAKSIIGINKALLDRFDGEIPSTREELESMPGIGRKTANVILNVVFGQPTVAVDTHVFRVANRVGLTAENSPEKTELALLKRIPEKYLLHAHHYLILHGRYTCTARSPKCVECLVFNQCQWREKSP